MRIELRDMNRQRVGRIQVDASLRPTRVHVLPSRNGKADDDVENQREVFLNWDTAVDDAGHLRRCVACECPDLFKERSFPLATGVIVLLAFVGAVVGLLGLATTPPVLFAMGIVLVSDFALLVFARRRLVCYQCRTMYYDLPIARYFRWWDRTIADRYPSPKAQSENNEDTSRGVSGAALTTVQ